MTAGRELDALVAEKVMGWRPWSGGYYYGTDGGRVLVCMFPGDGAARHWSPSTDIAAAWEVLEKLAPANRGDGPHLASVIVNPPHSAGQFPDDCPVGVWSVEWFDGKDCLDSVSADTAPLAICLAALKVVGAEAIA